MRSRLPCFAVPLLLLAPLVACSDNGAATASDSGVSADASGPNLDAAADAAVPDATVLPDASASDAGVSRTPQLRVLDYERSVDVTSDGTTALLWQQSTGALLFLDVATGTVTQKASLDLANIQNQQPMALSNSRRIAAIYGFQPDDAALWDEVNGWVRIASPLDGCVDDTVTPTVATSRGGAFDVSDDGHVAVGLLWQDCETVQAFRWTDASGAGEVTLLDAIGVGPDGESPGSNRATVVSADGLVAAGWAYNFVADRSPAVWRPDGTGFLLDPEDTDLPGEVLAISADGAVVAGVWARATGGVDGFTWSEAGGVVRFGPAADADLTTVTPTSMTGDARYVFGRWRYQLSFFDPADDHAFVWSAARGLRKLADIAAAHGLTPADDARLASVQAASADGTVFVGEATLPPAPEDPLQQPIVKTYLLVLPAGALDE